MRFKVFTAFKRIQDSLKASFSNSAISLFAIVICTGTFVHAASSPSQPSQLTVSSDPIAGTPATPTLGGANLVGYWKFDEGTGPFAIDSSGNGNTGTLANGPTWTAGMSGNALRFDGIDDNVTVFDSNVLDLSNSFTISAWVNPSSTTTDFRAVLAKNYKYYLYASGAGFCGDGNPLGGFYEGRDTVACEPRPLPVNTWSHLTVTYDGSTLTFYRNGLVGATAAVSGTLSPSTGTLQIGASEYGEYFQGLIDEVRVYNKRLSNAEIQTIYQQGAVNLPFDYAVTNSGNQSIYPGSSVTNTIVSTLSSGLSQPVSFSVSGLPPGASGFFSSVSCTLNCTTVLTVNTSGATPAGSYPITVTSVGGGLKKSTVFTISISLALTVATPTINPNAATPVAIGTGRTYYVAITGTDSNPGTILQPFRTVTKGVSALSAGDTLYIRSGSYSEGYHNVTPRSGSSWSNPITIARYQNEIVTFEGGNIVQFSGVSYVNFDGIIIAGGDTGLWFGNGTRHIRATRLEIKNHTSHGILINNTTSNIEISNCKIHDGGRTYYDNAIYISSPNNVVDGCEIYAHTGAGIQLWDQPTSNINNTIIRNNFIHNTSGAVSTARGGSGQAQGITVGTANNTLVYNNIVTNISCMDSCGSGGGSWGIGLFSWGLNNLIYNNTIYNIPNADGIQIDNRQSGAVLRNNIVYNTLGVNNRASDAVISNTLCSVAGPGCTLTGDPKFVNSAGNDFQLQIGSAAIDRGMILPDVTNDIIGVARPQGSSYDLGAHEYLR